MIWLVLLAVLSVSLRTTCVRLEVSLLTEQTEWNLSKNQTNLLIHEHSNDHRCPRKSLWFFPRIWCSRIKVGLLSSWSLPERLIRPSTIFQLLTIIYRFTGIRKWILRLWKYHLFRIESYRVDFWCVHRFQLFKVCNQYVTLPNSPRVESVSEEQSG